MITNKLSKKEQWIHFFSVIVVIIFLATLSTLIWILIWILILKFI